MAPRTAQRSRRPRPTRVAILDHTAELGGVELALVRFMDEVSTRDDIDVRVILFADGPLVGRLRERGHTVEVLPIDPGIGTTTRREAAGAVTALTSAVRSAP